MDTAEAPDVIDEATIKKVMEDVGLRFVDLNSEASELADIMSSTCENSSALSAGEDTPQTNGADNSQKCPENEEEQGSIAEETEGESEDEEEMPELTESHGAGIQTGNTDGEEDLSEDEEAIPRLSRQGSTPIKEDGKVSDNTICEMGSGNLEDDLLGHIDKGDQNQK